MDFYAGDAKRIGEAFAHRDHETLKNPEAVALHTDFSLHASSIDLDILTERRLGSPPRCAQGGLQRSS
jgi:hypothetical protein